VSNTFAHLTAADDTLASWIKVLTARCDWLRSTPARHLEAGDSMRIYNAKGMGIDITLEDICAEGDNPDQAIERLGEVLNWYGPPQQLVLLPPADQCPLTFENVAGWVVAKLRVGLA
jgi:hypothetical protein